VQNTSNVKNMAPDFVDDYISRSLLRPRLQQPMRLVDRLYFVAEHDDHHLARIWELTSA
jgi:hypothetical protein